MTVDDRNSVLSVDAAFYVLFVGGNALQRFPNAMKGTAFPEGLDIAPFTPDNEGKTYVFDPVPDFLAGKLRVIEHIKPETAFEKAYVNISVVPRLADNIPDIFMVKTPILSNRAKVVLEEFDPNLAFFYPAHLTYSNSGERIAGPYWSCMCRRQLFSQVKPNLDAADYTETDGPTGRHLPALYWVSGALDYLAATYPLLHDLGGSFSMNQDLFRHLKSAGLTGLNEIPKNARERISKWGETYFGNKEFISHVHWNHDPRVN